MNEQPETLMPTPISMTLAGMPVKGVDSGLDKFRINSVGTFDLDMVSGRFHGNHATARLLKQHKMINSLKQFKEIVHPDDYPKLLEALRRSQYEDELFKQQFRIKTADGSRWLEAVAGMEYTVGESHRLLGFIDDITARKELEKEKDRLYQDLEQMITTMDRHASSATLDLDGIIREVNGLFCEFCGLSEKELVGRKFTDLMLANPEDQAFPSSWNTIPANTSWTGQLSSHLPDSSIRIAHGSITPHQNDEGEIDTLIYLGFDLTSRFAAEQALQESIRAHQKSNQDLQMFAHIVSHDLCEPLRMVSSFMALLDRRYSAELNAEAREFIQFAVEGSERMSSLLSGLLEYSRVQTHAAPLEDITLDTAVQAAIDNLSVLIKESGANISVADLPVIQADATQMMQVFQNLLGNSMRFCDAQSPEIEIHAHQENHHWVVEIKDNGIGIEAIQHQRIFQMFQRLHARKDYSGSGVGLAICARIMERHGGSITVESEPGQGSLFRLHFPQARLEGS